jgi:hypothetical protein
MLADPAKCMAEAEELKMAAFAECECKEKANREYEASLQGQCSDLEGDKYDACKNVLWKVLQEALAECTPREVPAACVDFNRAGGLDHFNELQLTSHNTFRSHHTNTENLTFDADLAYQAYEYACYLSTEVGRLKHSANEDRPN